MTTADSGQQLPRICTPTDSYARHYPRIVELANQQLEKQFWTSSEMKVELDKMQLLYELNEPQKHSILTLLTLFVRYETMVGDMWARIAKLFPRPEVKLACSVCEMTERAIHAEFYNQPNQIYGLDTDEHYLSYLDNPHMAERAAWLGKLLAEDAEDPILSVIIFSMTETALLFSSFAILKSFQSNGYNLIPVTVRGTNQSAIDEDLHGQITAEIINTYYAELGTTLAEDTKRVEKIYEAVQYAYEHECALIDEAMLEESLNRVTKEDFRNFVKIRLNLWLERIGLAPAFVVGECQIEEWFGKNTYAYKVIDFFSAGMGMEYESSWNEDGFMSAWLEGEKDA